MTTLSGTMTDKSVGTMVLQLPGERWLAGIALTAITALAAVLRLANLSALGYANHYYTAAVEAMLQSWHNFFFVAAEPGGSVSVDKPPVGFWLQAISARLFGVNGFGVLLPQILAGILSVILLYYLVQRSFGKLAGLLAALALAITPVVIATDRNNTIDSTLVLTLLLAAWAFIKATETSRLRWLVLGVVLVGIGFNIKMLEAYLPLPAFFALYFFGSKDKLLPKIGKLALAALVLLVVSFSWATIVDLTPPDQRPWVGSTTDNSELSLIIGYNGVERLLGMGGRGGLLSGLVSGTQTGRTGQFPNGSFPPSGSRTGGFQPPLGQLGGNTFQPPQGGFGGFGGNNGFFNTGQPGALRLFIAPISNQMSWLLPFGLLGALVIAFRSRLYWPLSTRHQAIVLWGGWLFTGVVFFSIAGFFHEYYLTLLAPALAALIGITVVELMQLRENHPWLATLLVLGGTLATLAFQYYTAASFIRPVWWTPIMFGLLAIGAVFLLASVRSKMNAASMIGFACVVGALFITPGIWSALTTLNSSTNQSLPAAYNGGQPSFGPAGRGGAGTSLTGVQVNEALLNYLQANTQGMKYMMAVPSSMQGADYVIATGRGVLYLGGFDGQDPVETPASLAQLVANHELRYIYAQGGGGGFRGPGSGQSSISNWVTTACKPVTGYETTTENQGAPDGTGLGLQGDGGFNQFRGGTQVTLYDCGG